MNKKLRHYVTPCLVVLVIIYFAFYTLFGQRGLYRMFELQDHLQVTQIEYHEILKQRADLERNVALLKPNNLDIDMLDQRAREVLGLAHPDDIVIKFR